MRVLDCVHLCLHKGGQPQSSHAGQPSAVYALEDFCGIDAPFQWDHELHVMAVVCRQHIVTLALADKSTLDAWCLAIRCHLGCGISILRYLLPLLPLSFNFVLSSIKVWSYQFYHSYLLVSFKTWCQRLVCRAIDFLNPVLYFFVVSSSVLAEFNIDCGWA